MSVGKNSIRRITAATNGEAANPLEKEPKAAAPQTAKRSATPKKAAKITAAPHAAVRLGQPLPYWLL